MSGAFLQLLSIPAFIFACVIAVSTTPVVRAAARGRGLVAQPSKDRWHSAPTALFGGVAIFAALAVTIASFWLVNARAGAVDVTAPEWRQVLGITVAGALMFVTGLVDDLIHLRPSSKIVVQALAAAVLVTLDVRFVLTPYPVVNTLVTLFAFIAITNALNLLDNMDGAASGVAGVASLFFALLFLHGSHYGLAALAMAVSGATAGFLVFNFRPASIFMGDSGSLLLGAVLAGLAAAYSGSVAPGSPASVLVPILVLVVPVLDTSLVTVTRVLARYPVSRGGRDHTAHRLVTMGFSERSAALLLYALGAVGGGLALVLTFSAWAPSIWLIGVFMLSLVVLAAYLSRLYAYPLEGARSGGRLWVVLEDLLYKIRILEVALDLVVFLAAYFGAYVLRWDGAIPPGQMNVLIDTVALVMACKAVAFAFTGVYRGMWHQVGIMDVHRLVRATAVGSLLAIASLVLVYRGAQFSRSVIVLDAILCLLLTFGVRMSFRSFDRMRAVLSAGGELTAIFGAGTGGELTARALLANPRLGLTPVVFVDDNVRKHGRRLHGLPILLGTGDLRSLLNAHRVRALVISAENVGAPRLGELAEACSDAEIRILRMQIDLSVVTDMAAPSAGSRGHLLHVAS